MWGLPHNMPSQAARGFTLVPPPLFSFTFSKSIRKKKNLKQSKLSVPEGHCQIKIIANFANNKNAPADRRNAGPEAKRLILKTWPSGATNDY